MESNIGPQRTASSLSLDQAIAKITSAVTTINLRGRVLPYEEKRIEDGLKALETEERGMVELNKKEKRFGIYRQVLRQIKKKSGLQLVAVFAVGLGLSHTNSMKDRIRVLLPSKVEEHKHLLQSPIISKVVDKYRTTGKIFIFSQARYLMKPTLARDSTGSTLSMQPHQPTLVEHDPDGCPEVPLSVLGYETSRVFELTLGDLNNILKSDQVLGRVLLMEPHGKTLPFVTITISEESCGYFTAKRDRVG
jgi:hypothetical protein